MTDDVDRVAELLASAKSNIGAPFSQEALQLLRDLKQGNPNRYRDVIKELVQLGVSKTDLENAIKAPSQSSSARTQCDTLSRLLDEAEFFHSPDGTNYADVLIDGSRRIWPIDGKEFEYWLVAGFRKMTSGVPNPEALPKARLDANARAYIDGKQHDVFVRVARLGDRVYLDLLDKLSRVVEVSPIGWRIIQNPPVRFRREAGMLPLPEPKAGGSIELLTDLLNLRTDADAVLTGAWLLCALSGKAPYPVLAVSGEQGSAKSTCCKIIRRTIDPHVSSVRTLPRNDQDLFIATDRSHVLAYDNVSRLSLWLSDAFCQLATGANFSGRKLYTNREEVHFSVARPLLLNGIENSIERPDLAQRAIFLSLDRIPDHKRRTEEVVWREFDAQHPYILGALLDAVAVGLCDLPKVQIHALPRMADFASWATACERGLWRAGTFMNVYRENLANSAADVLEADEVACALISFMNVNALFEWSGTTTELLGCLEPFASTSAKDSKRWPRRSNLLSGRLTRAAPLLRSQGIQVDQVRIGHAGTRMIIITRQVDPNADSSSASSAEEDKASISVEIGGSSTIPDELR